MVNKIIDGISVRLHALFGDGYRIYADEDVKQGLQEPCFFIKPLNVMRNQLLDIRSHQLQPFDIHFFSQDGYTTEYEVAGELFDGMKRITLADGSTVRGSDMSFEAHDGVLHFFVSYNVFLKEIVEPDETMDELDIAVEGR